jgi:dephospho-CoA kinase
MCSMQFGKPGSGKGTISNKLIKKYDVSQLSAGDLLRAQIAEGLVIFPQSPLPAIGRTSVEAVGLKRSCADSHLSLQK